MTILRTDLLNWGTKSFCVASAFTALGETPSFDAVPGCNCQGLNVALDRSCEGGAASTTQLVPSSSANTTLYLRNRALLSRAAVHQPLEVIFHLCEIKSLFNRGHLDTIALFHASAMYPPLMVRFLWASIPQTEKCNRTNITSTIERFMSSIMNTKVSRSHVLKQSGEDFLAKVVSPFDTV
jgi:hypothetical protein